MGIVEAYKQIDEVKQFYKEMRENVDTEFNKVYTQAERINGCSCIHVEPCKPRSCARQRHRTNTAIESIEECIPNKCHHFIPGPHHDRA